MKYSIGVAALTKGLELLQKTPTGAWNVALLHSHHARFLQDMTTMYQTTSSSTFGSPEQDEIIKQGMDLLKTKCQLDVEELVSKVGMLMMGGDLGMPMGFGDDSTQNVDPKKAAKPSVADQVAMSNLIQEALTPEGEKQCTKAQNKQYIAASASFAKCIGFDSVEEMEVDTDHMVQITNMCDATAMMADTDNCTDAILSDEIIGGALRDVYQHPGKYCTCLKALKNDIPACTATMGSLMDDSGEKVPAGFDEAYRETKVSLGFAKMELCALGLGCDALDGVCVDQLNGLEECLMTHPGCKEEVLSKECEENVFFLAPSQLSQGLLPDICLKAYNDHKMSSGVVDDYANYVKACDPTVTTLVSVKEASKPSASKSEPSANSSSGNWIDFMVIMGVVVVAIVGFALALALYMQKQRKVTFTPVYTDDEGIEAELGEFS